MSSTVKSLAVYGALCFGVGIAALGSHSTLALVRAVQVLHSAHF